MRVIVRPFDWIAALFAVPALGLMVPALINPRSYAAGLANNSAPFLFIEGFLFIAGALLELGGLIWVFAMWGRSSKATRIFGVAVCCLPLLLAAGELLLPLHMYRRGLARWAATHTNAAGIRTWYAGMAVAPGASPPSTGPAAPFAGAQRIDPTDYPADVAILAPAYVWSAPGHRGIYLEWGDSMGWSSARHLFVGIDARESAPTELGGWTRAQPGVYVTDR